MEQLARDMSFTPYYVSNKYNDSSPLRVAIYARVSTEHESQCNAFENQILFWDSIFKMHSNWLRINMYADKGITGLQASKRPQFLQMIEDAKKGMFDLIVTREVSRFARNSLDSISYTRLLKANNVEVFFYNDNMWTFDADSELRLSIMGALAQDESRHTSERSRAGQKTSRERHVLYGTGNILGYNLVRGSKSVDNTYEINPEQAKTVRMIYDYYTEEGLGIKAIARKMQELHRLTATNTTKWTPNIITRVLDNKTYAGYICYHKSYTPDYLSHKRIAVKDKSKHIYVKGDFEPIISEEQWLKTQQIKERRQIVHNGFTKGKRESNDKWRRVLKCECGASFKKYKWRVNKSTGEECIGYECANKINNKSRDFREKNGLETEGYCNMTPVVAWKLDFMLKEILNKLWTDVESVIEEIKHDVATFYVPEDVASQVDKERLKREEDRLLARKNNLLDLRLDDKVDKDTFDNKLNQIESRIENIRLQLKTEDNSDNPEKEDISTIIESVECVLLKVCNLDEKFLDDDLVKETVDRVIAYEDGSFSWFLKNPELSELDAFNQSNYSKIDEFVLDFNQAKNYRKKYGNYIRARQWRDIKVRVYVRTI